MKKIMPKKYFLIITMLLFLFIIPNCKKEKVNDANKTKEKNSIVNEIYKNSKDKYEFTNEMKLLVHYNKYSVRDIETKSLKLIEVTDDLQKKGDIYYSLTILHLNDPDKCEQYYEFAIKYPQKNEALFRLNKVRVHCILNMGSEKFGKDVRYPAIDAWLDGYQYLIKDINQDRYKKTFIDELKSCGINDPQKRQECISQNEQVSDYVEKQNSLIIRKYGYLGQLLYTIKVTKSKEYIEYFEKAARQKLEKEEDVAEVIGYLNGVPLSDSVFEYVRP